jgi:hypothetical protein
MLLSTDIALNNSAASSTPDRYSAIGSASLAAATLAIMGLAQYLQASTLIGRICLHKKLPKFSLDKQPFFMS